MYFLDELLDLKLYNRKFLLPIDETNKRRNSAAILLSPDQKSSIDFINNPMFVNRYYNSYFMERAALYIINQEGIEESFNMKYINEEYDMVKPTNIIFSGYDIDIENAKEYINESHIKDLAEEYGIKIKKPIKVTVSRNKNCQYSTYDTIYVESKDSYNKDVFESYKKYCDFCIHVYLVLNINNKIKKSLALATALYKSGYDYNKSGYDYNKSWKFKDNLKIICKAIDVYIHNNSWKIFVKNVLKPEKGYLELNVSITDIYSLLSRDLKKLFKPLVNDKDTVTLSESTGIILNEDSSYNAQLKRILFNDRIKNIKELQASYLQVKNQCDRIKYTYNSFDMYKGLNMFIDTSHYNFSFVKNNTYSKIRGASIYLDLIDRLINDKKYNIYKNQTVIIPVIDWYNACNKPDMFWLVNSSINPVSCIYYLMLRNPLKLKEIFKNRTVLFIGTNSYMKINFENYDTKNNPIFVKRIKSIILKQPVTDDITDKQSSPKAIKMNIIADIERSQDVIIDDISATSSSLASTSSSISPAKIVSTAAKAKIASSIVNTAKEKTPSAPEEIEQKTDTSSAEEVKTKLVAKVDDISKNKTTYDSALDAIDTDEDNEIKKLLSDLASNPDNGGSNISGARASRLLQLQNDFLDQQYEGVPIRDILNRGDAQAVDEIPPKKLDIDSVNPEWKELKYANTIDSYNMDQDIIRILGSFYNTSNPLAVRDFSVEDTSTSEDLIVTYTCHYESARGERFTIKVDVPKFIDNKYMKLRGNRKNIPIQLFLMPIIKTDEDAVQIVSCYNKIFVRRFGTTSGKSNPITDKLIKALNKEKYDDIIVYTGDNSRVCSKYELPIDYIDIASSFSKIITKQYTFFFNQDELRKDYDVDDSKGLCFGIDNKSKELVYFKSDPKNPTFFSYYLLLLIETSAETDSVKKFIENYNTAAKSVRYMFSRVSILNTNIPLIVVCAYSEGLEPVLKKAGIKYKLSESRPKINVETEDYIKFKDGYVTYELNYASCLLMNGLKVCNTDEYSILEINSKPMYVDFLDSFGGRIKADGLDNFYDCMVDPITAETLNHYKLPTDYISILLYANSLLADNRYTMHGDIRASRRFRRQEQIASMLYDILSSAYGAYSTGLKHGRNIGFSIKQSALIDKVLTNNTTDDQTILNALGEYEAYNTVTPKGPSGMNSDRAYSLDKRSYDPSMLNVLSASTGFAGNVGISRQATIDANVKGDRGYIYNDPDSNEDINPVKSLCMTEALTPFGPTRDDPMRLAMGFIQTQKHGMRSVKSDPLLITNGADEALPYLISNTFAYKSKEDGVVKELTDDYMILEYPKLEGKDKYEYVDLSESIQKNSSSGFYIVLKLDTDLKVGSKVKKDQIVAYDKSSFSDKVGYDKNIAYNIGTLAKFAILNTDEGFEDSAIISNALSEGLASDIVTCEDFTIPKDANIYNLVKKGQEIQEGDTLMILQNSYEDEDVNVLLKNLVGDEEEITNLGRIPITSHITGTVQDIIITRTVEPSELSPTLKKIVTSYEKDVNDKKKVLKQYGIEDTNHILPDIKTLPPTGKLKHASDSVRIEIYLRRHDKFKPGDKLIYGTAVKGVDKDIFPVGLEPYSEYRKNEKIHALLSIGSINARMVTSVLITTAINKGLIELSRKCKDILGIKYNDNLLE